MTASRLLAELRAAGCEPGVDGADLVFESTPPPRLARYLGVLHTGVRALLARRPWYGFDTRTCRPLGPPPDCTLNPNRKLPHPRACLCVAGDREHDRIHPFAGVDAPELFDDPNPPDRPAGKGAK